MKTTLYHNPNCSKSRQTLQLLNEKASDLNIDLNVVEYLKTPPTAAQLGAILNALDMQPREFIRKGEADYKELNLADESLTREQLIAAMVAHPKLIERPVLVVNDAEKAAIGRPPESVLDIL